MFHIKLKDLGNPKRITHLAERGIVVLQQVSTLDNMSFKVVVNGKTVDETKSIRKAIGVFNKAMDKHYSSKETKSTKKK